MHARQATRPALDQGPRSAARGAEIDLVAVLQLARGDAGLGKRLIEIDLERPPGPCNPATSRTRASRSRPGSERGVAVRTTGLFNDSLRLRMGAYRPNCAWAHVHVSIDVRFRGATAKSLLCTSVQQYVTARERRSLPKTGARAYRPGCPLRCRPIIYARSSADEFRREPMPFCASHDDRPTFRSQERY